MQKPIFINTFFANCYIKANVTAIWPHWSVQNETYRNVYSWVSACWNVYAGYGTLHVSDTLDCD